MHGTFMPGCFEAMRAPSRWMTITRTRTRGACATALAHNNRKEDNRVLRTDVAALLKAANKGAYTYYDNTSDAGREGNWDNSNSQYGLLGVWSGAEADIVIPSSYWTEVEKTLDELPGVQVDSGQYRQTEYSPLLTMTCAGIASLFVCHDWLDAAKYGTAVGRPPMSAALKKALDWLEEGDQFDQHVGGDEWGYTLYSVERVGLASGLKFFGKHNWYPELANQVLSRQGDDGAWGSRIDTAYALLFLSRGRHPIIMNKLRYDGYWANRPRDVANLATYASREMEAAA